jgi:hypothetical protein
LTNPVTDEFTAALVNLLCMYPEKVVADVLHPTMGLPSRFKYLPTIAEFKKEFEGEVSSIWWRAYRKEQERNQQLNAEERAARELEMRLRAGERLHPTPKAEERPVYTGPIENVKPGDLLTYDRLAEYDAFMRKTHGIKPRHFGVFEDWEDSGARPFSAKVDLNLSYKNKTSELDAKPEDGEKNPFEE